MTGFDHAAGGTGITARTALDLLSRATSGTRVVTARRIVAASHKYDPGEGLALLEAYVGIADQAVRQAVLDVVLALTEA